MTTSDKTGEKLVASIRRTKTSAATKGESAAAKKPTPSQEPAGESAAAEAATAPPQKEGLLDTYQSVGRVWPD